MTGHEEILSNMGQISIFGATPFSKTRASPGQVGKSLIHIRLALAKGKFYQAEREAGFPSVRSRLRAGGLTPLPPIEIEIEIEIEIGIWIPLQHLQYAIDFPSVTC